MTSPSNADLREAITELERDLWMINADVEREIYVTLVNALTDENKYHLKYKPKDAQNEAWAYIELLKRKYGVSDLVNTSVPSQFEPLKSVQSDPKRKANT